MQSDSRRSNFKREIRHHRYHRHHRRCRRERPRFSRRFLPFRSCSPRVSVSCASSTPTTSSRDRIPWLPVSRRDGTGRRPFSSDGEYVRRRCRGSLAALNSPYVTILSRIYMILPRCVTERTENGYYIYLISRWSSRRSALEREASEEWVNCPPEARRRCAAHSRLLLRVICDRQVNTIT